MEDEEFIFEEIEKYMKGEHPLEDAFINFCYNGELEMAKWILEKSQETKYQINIRTENDIAFRLAVYNWAWEVADWLCELCPEYEVKFNNGYVKAIVHNKK